MCLKDLKSKNKKRGGFALVINITTKRHNFPKYAVKRRQTPSKAFWCLCPWLWIRGVRCQNGGCWGCLSLLPALRVSDPPPLGLPQQGPALLAPAHAVNIQHILGCPRQTAEPSSPASWSAGKLMIQRFWSKLTTLPRREPKNPLGSFLHRNPF